MEKLILLRNEQTKKLLSLRKKAKELIGILKKVELKYCSEEIKILHDKIVKEFNKLREERRDTKNKIRELKQKKTIKDLPNEIKGKIMEYLLPYHAISDAGYVNHFLNKNDYSCVICFLSGNEYLMELLNRRFVIGANIGNRRIKKCKKRISEFYFYINYLNMYLSKKLKAREIIKGYIKKEREVDCCLITRRYYNKCFMDSYWLKNVTYNKMKDFRNLIYAYKRKKENNYYICLKTIMLTIKNSGDEFLMREVQEVLNKNSINLKYIIKFD